MHDSQFFYAYIFYLKRALKNDEFVTPLQSTKNIFVYNAAAA